MPVTTTASVAGSADAAVETVEEGGRLVLRFRGDWTTETLAARARRLRGVAGLDPSRGIPPRQDRPVLLDLGGVDALDTNGALLVHDTADRFRKAGAAVEVTGLNERQQALFEAVAAAAAVGRIEAHVEPHSILAMVERLGRATFGAARSGKELLNFLGAVTTVMVASLLRPWRLRGRALVSHMEATGLDALPIVGLLSFLIGVVTAYQGADQLARFGAQIYVANLVGLGILREMGVLITAIIVAGRSGSAFTAQIGTMKVNQEVDAMFTIGLDPLEVLVLPRVLALIIVMPLLTFYADICGLVGGAVMATIALDVTFQQFGTQLQNAVNVGSFAVGLVKAPLFAFIIAVVGCFEGMQVSQNAESVGARTTQSVVLSIFLVIVMDALLSVFFSVIKV